MPKSQAPNDQQIPNVQVPVREERSASWSLRLGSRTAGSGIGHWALSIDWSLGSWDLVIHRLPRLRCVVTDRATRFGYSYAALAGSFSWQCRHRGQQALGVGMLRMDDNLLGRAELDQLALLRDRDTVGQVTHHAEVVRDEQVGQAELLAKLLQQDENLGLNRDVKRGDRLVQDDERGLNGERAGNADALTHPAAQLMRVAMRVLRGQPDLREQFPDASISLGRGRMEVQPQRQAQDVVHALARGERRVRVLEDHLHLPPDGTQLPVAQVRDVLAVEEDAPSRGRHEAKDQPGERGLAAPALAHQAESLAFVNGE